MPVYDFSVAAERLACLMAQPTKKRMKSIAEIVKKHYGADAVQQMREDYKDANGS